jgi:hypothetical protein
MVLRGRRYGSRVASAPPGTYWVDRGRLLAGPYPGGADAADTGRRLDALREAGVSLVVDLTEVDEAVPYAQLLRGAVHERRPIPDFGIVPPEEVAATLDLIDGRLDEGGTVYVHCLGGLGRTGTVIGCWLARHALDCGDPVRRIADLRRELAEGRHRSPQTPEQCDLVTGWRRGE